MRLEICGGIAAGKTTLARLLADLPVRPVYESFRDNPFWEAFYTQPGQHVFETELTFLLQHYHQLKIAAAQERTPVVADFSLMLDLAYADVGLSGRRLRLFEALRREVVNEIGPPAVVVHIECPASVELTRIHARSRQEEKIIDTAFLSALNRAIARRVARVGRGTHVIVLNSEKVNFATDRPRRLAVLSAIRGVLSEAPARRPARRKHRTR